MPKQYDLQNKEYYILYIEDNLGDVLLLKEAFENQGIPINFQHIIDGENAIDIILDKDSSKPDLIIIDINIPKVDGITILGLLKQSQKYKHVPAIMLSSSNNEADIDICHKLGASSYLIKPLDWVQYENIAKSISETFFVDSIKNYSSF